MITKKDLNESAHEVACMQQGEIVQLRTDLAASQSRECAMRVILEELAEPGGLAETELDNEEGHWSKAMREALSPAPVGWIRLRWRPGTEVPDPNTNVIVRSADGYWMAGLNRVIRASDFWLYAYELKGATP